jgi:hypothetical protein
MFRRRRGGRRICCTRGPAFQAKEGNPSVHMGRCQKLTIPRERPRHRGSVSVGLETLASPSIAGAPHISVTRTSGHGAESRRSRIKHWLTRPWSAASGSDPGLYKTPRSRIVGANASRVRRPCRREDGRNLAPSSDSAQIGAGLSVVWLQGWLTTRQDETDRTDGPRLERCEGELTNRKVAPPAGTPKLERPGRTESNAVRPKTAVGRSKIR